MFRALDSFHTSEQQLVESGQEVADDDPVLEGRWHLFERITGTNRGRGRGKGRSAPPEPVGPNPAATPPASNEDQAPQKSGDVLEVAAPVILQKLADKLSDDPNFVAALGDVLDDVYKMSELGEAAQLDALDLAASLRARAAEAAQANRELKQATDDVSQQVSPGTGEPMTGVEVVPGETGTVSNDDTVAGPVAPSDAPGATPASEGPDVTPASLGPDAVPPAGDPVEPTTVAPAEGVTVQGTPDDPTGETVVMDDAGDTLQG